MFYAYPTNAKKQQQNLNLSFQLPKVPSFKIIRSNPYYYDYIMASLYKLYNITVLLFNLASSEYSEYTKSPRSNLSVTISIFGFDNVTQLKQATFIMQSGNLDSLISKQFFHYGHVYINVGPPYIKNTPDS